MRLQLRPALALLLLAALPADDETLPIPAMVESSLATQGKQIRQLAFDADPTTFFESKTNPTVADQFLLRFDRPVVLKLVKVTTGKPDGSEKLGMGSLQTSADGEHFDDVAKFVDGSVRYEPKILPIRAVRIKPTADLAHPLAIDEITIESAEPIATFRYPVEFTIDVADAPEMKPWADQVVSLCERWYPRINDELKSDGYKPATQISIAMKSNYNGVAQASGTRITGSVKYFKEHPEDLGAMIHETCHVVQRYRGRGNPSWLVEGVADYFRFFVFEPGKAGPVNPRRAHYNQSYRTSASFLAYVSDKYDKELVLKLNKLMREGKYKEEVFKELTGKTVQELDEEWLGSLAR